jgi:thiol-disulfide isomerase/thioredoxin
MCRILFIIFLLFGSQLADAQSEMSEYFEMTASDSSQIGILADEYFPTTKFININNEEVSFEDKKYQLTIVNFWFKGCRGCVSEKPFLKKLTEHYKDYPKIRFISITPTNDAGIEKTIKKHGNTNYDMISLGNFKRVEELFHFKSYPRHVIVNNDAKVLAQYITPIPTDEFLEEYINRIDGFLKKGNN